MMPIVKYPDPILETKCNEVKDFSEIHKMLDAMAEAMRAGNGIGLASNQLGFLLRMFVMLDQKGRLWEFVNPEIVDRDGSIQINEGCLSAPGVYVQIPRSEVVTVKAQDRDGNEFTVVCEGIEAVCVQHEINHLEGIFFLSKTTRNQRRAALRQLGIK